MKSWKSPFRTLAGPLGHREEKDADGQSASIARLRTVMAELKEGDAEYDARNPISDDDAVGVRPSASPVSAARAAAVAAPAAPPSVPVAASTNGTALGDDEPISVARRLISEQRKAAESLLQEAYRLEERLKSEAVVSHAFEEVDEAERELEAAQGTEQAAKDAARVAAEQRGAVAAERRDAEGQVVSARGDVKAARAKVVHLEQQLRDAKQGVEQALSMVGLRESRVRECVAKETEAKRAATETHSRVLACESARMAAERKVEAARRRADEMNADSIPDGDAPSMEGVRQLADRIAQTKSALRNGSQQRAAS